MSKILFNPRPRSAHGGQHHASIGDSPPEFAMAAVGFQDTTNDHTVLPKAATPQVLLLEIVVLTSFSRAAGATPEARFSLLPPFAASRNR